MLDYTPQEIADIVIRKVGVKKANIPFFEMFILGILAGAYIAFAGVLATVVTFDMVPKFGLGFTSFVKGAVFSFGLMLVIIAGAQLFTGDVMMLATWLDKKISFSKLLKTWTVIYIANFIGSIIIVLLFYYSNLWQTSSGDFTVATAAVNTAYKKVNLDFIEALIRGIGCNWLVCLAVWMALGSKQIIGKIFAIFFPIMAFVAIGFEHSIANMYFIPMGIILKDTANILTPVMTNPDTLNWVNFFINNLIPVTIGNIIGGGLFVSIFYKWTYLNKEELKN